MAVGAEMHSKAVGGKPTICSKYSFEPISNQSVVVSLPEETGPAIGRSFFHLAGGLVAIIATELTEFALVFGVKLIVAGDWNTIKLAIPPYLFHLFASSAFVYWLVDLTNE